MAARFDNLDDWLDWQAALHPAEIDLGLDRVRAVHQRLGGRRPAPLVITFAGTNGKGSALVLTEAILRQAGYRVGAYTSPHLMRYNERVRIDGRSVTDGALCAAFERIDAARGEISLTYFEFGTLAALEIFADAAPDIVLLETGLGGRLDAVNIIDADVAVITRIGIDHEAFLGDTREAVAREKAGILRAGRPAVIADADPPATLLAYAAEQGVPLQRLGRDFDVFRRGGRWEWLGGGRRLGPLPPPALAGSHQYANAAAAVAAVEQLGGKLTVHRSAIEAGLVAAGLPGRLQRLAVAPEVVADIAHNPQAMAAVVRSLLERPVAGVNRIVLGMLADKSHAAVVQALAPLAPRWYLASPACPRALPADSLAGVIRHTLGDAAAVFDSVDAAFDEARAQAGEGDRILVTGSFYTVAEVMARYYPHGL